MTVVEWPLIVCESDSTDFALGIGQHVRDAVSCCCGSGGCVVEHMSHDDLLQNQGVRRGCLKVMAGCTFASMLITSTQEGTCCLAAAVAKGT